MTYFEASTQAFSLPDQFLAFGGLGSKALLDFFMLEQPRPQG